MKKLLAVMLVLGIASMANAALTLSTESPAPVAGPVTILADGTEPGGWYLALVIANAEGTLNGGILGGSADTDFSFIEPYAGSFIDGFFPEVNGYFIGLDTIQLNLAVGPQITANYEVGSSGGTIKLYSVDDAGGSELLDEVFVPEPMTMSLLALGGLGLLRRR